MGNETSETRMSPPFPVGHGTRHRMRTKIPFQPSRLDAVQDGSAIAVQCWHRNPDRAGGIRAQRQRLPETSSRQNFRLVASLAVERIFSGEFESITQGPRSVKPPGCYSAASSGREMLSGQERCCDDRQIRSAGSYDPELSRFSDLRRRGCRSGPGNDSPLP